MIKRKKKHCASNYNCRSKGLTYSDAGVNIDAGNTLVNVIKPLAASTARAGCTAELGGFGGFFDLLAAGYKEPLLVSGTDGVGTKLKVRFCTQLYMYLFSYLILTKFFNFEKNRKI